MPHSSLTPLAPSAARVPLAPPSSGGAQSIATRAPLRPRKPTPVGIVALRVVLVLILLLTQSGCYYGHLASGQIKILWRRQPIKEALATPSIDPETRALLALVEPVRAYAESLGLSVGDQYTSYVDWPEDRLVTTLVRTAPNSSELVEWWFPVLGHLPYKGYFNRTWAEEEAAKLRKEDAYDVCVSGVSAYSTLGWLDDPVTTPMLKRGAASLVETLLHELVHATAFLPDAADFNESAAQFIGQQAAIRFFTEKRDQALLAIQSAAEDDAQETLPLEIPSGTKVRDAIQDRRAIAAATLRFRTSLEDLEGVPDRARRRGEAEDEMRDRLRELPLAVYSGERVAEKARLSDACLALGGTYAEALPDHEALFEALGGDLEAQIQRLVRWSEEERSVESFFQPTSAETP
ncbi:MAG: aminopeptidase [Myxococcota bacterium]